MKKSALGAPAWVRIGAVAAVTTAAVATLALSRTPPVQEAQRVAYSADIKCYSPTGNPREYVMRASFWEGDSIAGYTVAEKQDSVAIDIHVSGERQGEIFRHGSGAFPRIALSEPLAGRRMVDRSGKDVLLIVDCAP